MQWKNKIEVNLTFPNILSLLRVVIAPFFLWFLISDNEFLVVSAFWLYVIGAITDYFDGWMARKLNLITSFGRFIDPLADKVLTTAAFVGFIVLDIIPAWMVVLILLRDIGTTIMRVVGDNNATPVVTSKIAKLKTFIQMAFIWLVLLLLYFKTADILPFTIADYDAIIYSTATYMIMLFITILSVYTLVDYLLENKLKLKLSRKKLL